MSKVTVVFELEKETKNTLRFSEISTDILDTPKVGTIYVPKATLKDIGYTQGAQLKMDLYV